MNLLVGIDVVEVARFERLLARSPEFAEHYFTAAERNACAGSPARWACCFAVKEAFLKALGTGVLGSIPLGDVEVTFGERGAAFVIAHAHARDALADLRPWASTALAAGKAWATVVLAAP
jgi:holo-[acyl-carrier protein] synthase